MFNVMHCIAMRIRQVGLEANTMHMAVADRII